MRVGVEENETAVDVAGASCVLLGVVDTVKLATVDVGGAVNDK